MVDQTLAQDPLAKPKDLEGKTLAAPPGDSQRQMFPAFAKVNGIDAAKAIRFGADLVGQAAGVLQAATESTEAVVEHFEIDGHSVLELDIDPAK